MEDVYFFLFQQPQDLPCGFEIVFSARQFKVDKPDGRCGVIWQFEVFMFSGNAQVHIKLIKI